VEARNAGGLDRAASAAASERGLAAASAAPWYRRVVFWRAVAGMALAIAIACAMVAAEFSSALIERSRHYHNRLHQLSSNITAMRGEIAGADREIAGMRTAVEVDDDLRRIIAAPDSRLIRLEAPAHATGATGVIAFSPALGRAAIEIGGVPMLPSADAYTLWWLCGRRGALKAVRISAGAAGKCAMVIALPAGAAAIEGAIVTSDLATSMAMRPGVAALKGALVPPPVRMRTPDRKTR